MMVSLGRILMGLGQALSEKKSGPAAPLGQIDFVIKGAIIGGLKPGKTWHPTEDQW